MFNFIKTKSRPGKTLGLTFLGIYIGKCSYSYTFVPCDQKPNPNSQPMNRHKTFVINGKQLENDHPIKLAHDVEISNYATETCIQINNAQIFVNVNNADGNTCFEINICEKNTDKDTNKNQLPIPDEELAHFIDFFNNIQTTDYDYFIFLLKNYPAWLKYVKNQSTEICELAIDEDFNTLQYVKNQTVKLSKRAIDKDPRAFAHVKDKTDELHKYTIEKIFKHVSVGTGTVNRYCETVL